MMRKLMILDGKKIDALYSNKADEKVEKFYASDNNEMDEVERIDAFERNEADEVGESRYLWQ